MTVKYPTSLNELDPCYTSWKEYLIYSYASHLNTNNLQQNTNYQISNHLLNDVNDDLATLPIPGSTKQGALSPAFGTNSRDSDDSTSIHTSDGATYNVGEHIVENRKQILHKRQSQATLEPDLIQNFKLQNQNQGFTVVFLRKLLNILLCRGD